MGSENEMKKISTEYVSNMLEKFEVDQHKNGSFRDQSHQAKGNSSKRASEDANTPSANMPTQPIASTEEFVPVIRGNAKKQKKKKKAKEQGQPLLKT